MKALVGLLGFALLVGCGPDYSLPPTVCDDFCRATQRGDCDDDAPADCVRECERERAGASCDTPLRALGNCYAASPSEAFACVDEHSEVSAVCLEERRALLECTVPGSGVCFDECVRQSDACHASLADCERDCRHPKPGCEGVTIALDACLQGFPVECHEWLAPETRSEQQIPCYDQILELFACVK